MAPLYPTHKSQATMESIPSIADEVFVLPASVAQQRFWLLDQLAPGNTSLNMPLALRLSGALDITALERTLNEIVARHEVLRTTFMLENDKLAQVIMRETWLSFDVVDISDLGAAEREERARCLMIDEAHITFDLARGPLFKAKVLALGAEDHILLLTLHHIICDGWSNGVLVRELGEIYDALSKGEPSSLAELPIQYGDFAVWQQELLKRNGFDEQLEYWKSQLGSELPTLELPTDFPRRKNRTSFGAIESLLIPQPLTRALKALGRHEDVTLFTICLAAFKVLLHRYSGQNNILVGSPTANRIQGQTEGLIGAFANTLLLKTDLSGNPSFRETLQRVKEVSLGALLNQTLPFEKLVEQIKPAQSRTSAQLFQVLFVFQTAFMQPVELSDLTMTPMRSVSPGSIFELSLGVVERAEGTRLQLEYNTDLFEANTIKGILENLHSILQSAVTDIRQKISDIVLPTSPPTLQGAMDGQPLPGTDETSQVIADVRDDQPRDLLEASLIEIWEEVLHGPVGIRDDFFELGGHSLLATQVISRVIETFHVDLPLRALLEAPTVAELSKVIATLTQTEQAKRMPPLVPGDRRASLPLSFAQQRLWFFDQLEPASSAYNISCALRLKGPLDARALQQSLDAIVARHEVLRTSFLNDNGKPALSIAESAALEISLFDLSQLPASEQEKSAREVAAQETQRPFTLGHGPLLRAGLVRLRDEEHVLLLTMHHIISDGWSIGVFLREFALLYNAFTRGENPALPALPLHYVDFAAWQRSWLNGGALQQQLNYWRDQLAGAPRVIALPLDRPRPPVRSFRGAKSSFAITRGITDKLRALARGERATLFMTLLAAFQSLLSCLTNQDDIVVGSPTAGRNRPELEGLIGYFVNTIVLRAQLSGDPDFLECLRRSRAFALGAFANQDVPFEKLVDELQPARSLQINPLFQAWFWLQNAQGERQELQGLTSESLDIDAAATRHDLQLTLWETVNGLEGAFTYSTDLFEAETISCMAEQFRSLLAVVVEQPQIRLSAVRVAVDDAGRAYRDKLAGRLEEESRRTLKSTKRKAVS